MKGAPSAFDRSTRSSAPQSDLRKTRFQEPRRQANPITVMEGGEEEEYEEQYDEEEEEGEQYDEE